MELRPPTVAIFRLEAQGSSEKARDTRARSNVASRLWPLLLKPSAELLSPCTYYIVLLLPLTAPREDEGATAAEEESTVQTEYQFLKGRDSPQECNLL